jgi:PAS domain S-box-containing protein
MIDNRSVSSNKIPDLQNKPASPDLAQICLRLFTHCPYGVILLESDSDQILTCNPAFAKSQRYGINELSGMSIRSLCAPQDYSVLQNGLQRANDAGESSFKICLLRQDGSSYPTQINVTNVLEEDSHPAYRICALVDISDHEKIKQEIKQRDENFSLINSFNDKINSESPFEEVLLHWSEEWKSIFSTPNVDICLLSMDGKYLELQGSTAIHISQISENVEDIIGFKIPKAKIPINEVDYLQSFFSQKQEILTEDIQEIDRWIDVFTHSTMLTPLQQSSARQFIPQIRDLLQIHSLLLIPLISSGQAVGLLATSSQNHVTEAQLSRVSFIAHQITGGILRRRSEDHTRIQFQRLKTLNEINRMINATMDLHLTMEILVKKVRSLLQVDAATIWLVDPDQQTIDLFIQEGCNNFSSMKQHIGYNHGLVGRVAMDRAILHISDLPKANAKYEFSKSILDEGFMVYVGVPLISKGELKGIMEIFMRSSFIPPEDWLDFLEMLGGQAALAIDNVQAFDALHKTNMELMTAYDAAIEGWSRALDLHDHKTAGHTKRVTEMTLKFAEAMNFSPAELVNIRRGVLLHDIGKLGIPDNILLKTEPLAPEELQIMRQHPKFAWELLSQIDYLRSALDIPYCHHENWDGSGYPRGLKGEEIPFTGRLFAVINIWDKLTCESANNSAWPREKALQYIQERSGSEFDPSIVNIFINEIEKME